MNQPEPAKIRPIDRDAVQLRIRDVDAPYSESSAARPSSSRVLAASISMLFAIAFAASGPAIAQFVPGDLNDDGTKDLLDSVVLQRDLVGLGPGISQTCAIPTCGDAVCDPSEDCGSCFADCGACAEDPQAIYVSSAGGADDPACGSQAAPCVTIGFGLAQAQTLARERVLVARGEYFEDVTLIDDVDLQGSFDPGSWLPANHGIRDSVLYGMTGTGHRSAVTAANITQPTSFAAFTVYGAPATSAGANSYALYMTDSGELSVTNSTIFAGAGGPGWVGSIGDGGNSGGDGGSGPGAFIATGDGFCNTSNNRQLANGGASSCSVFGGSGGGNQCPVSSTFAESSGSDGAGGQASAGGGFGGVPGDAGNDGFLDLNGLTCGIPPPPDELDGSAGTDGASGNQGGGGAGCGNVIGSVFADHWSTGPGVPGSAGRNGGGGGGGGAGGGGFCNSCPENKDRLGAHGGGGGGGGCGGGAGDAGGPGGGSFGVFVLGSNPPSLSESTIFLGLAGDGGRGGDGGVGGEGGLGGSGGTTIEVPLCAGSAGHGGEGGSGGSGGGGGGGCGGSAFGIYTFGAGTPDYCLPAANLTIAGGVGGAGGLAGLSLGQSGSNGAFGNVIDCSFN